METEVLLSLELREFLESGLAIVIATRDGELQPDGSVAWAVRVHEDRSHLTVFLHELAAMEMLRNLEAHPEIAIDFDQPTSHRACQVKGVFLASRRAEDSERAEIERQIAGFAADLEAIGIPRAATAGWKTWPCTALELRVATLYEQTPGPGAGDPLR